MSLTSQPQISFIFSFHNAETEVESFLTPFFNLQNIRSEMIIVNDGSNDETDSIITSLLEFYNHDNAYYFSHETPKGHGICLNDAIREVNAPYFVIIDKECTISEEILEKVLLALESNSASAAVANTLNSQNHGALTQMLTNFKAPSSVHYVLAANRLPPDKFVINPFIHAGHSCELLLRCGNHAEVLKVEQFIIPVDEDDLISVSPADSKTILFHSGIDREVSDEGHVSQNTEDSLSDSEIHKKWEKVEYLREEGHFAQALDLVNTILKNDPEHNQAEETKIFLLERLNRYVEASELKFVRKRKKMHLPAHKEPVEKEKILVSRPAKEPEIMKPSKVEPEANRPAHPAIDTFKHTVIIPVTGVAMPFIEPCMIALDLHCNPEDTELIVIDNACFDDTYSYLDQLRERNFFNIRIIKNIRNAGFARSINQGIEKAKGDFIFVMHADVVIESNVPAQLSELLKQHPDCGLIGPVTDNTMNPDQARKRSDSAHEVEASTYLDSFLFGFPNSHTFQMDTRYNQAWFDDVDLCWQVRESGKNILIAPGVEVRHYFGAFTDRMGLGYDSELYQDNLHAFNVKWKHPAPQVDTSEQGDSIDELIKWGSAVNIYHPYPEVTNRAKELFTDELKTMILNASFNQDELSALVRLMMVMEQRDVLRQLEERLTEPIDEALRNELISYYFKLNVFSRCRKYLDLSHGVESLSNRLYRLRIAWREKDMELVHSLLEELRDISPGNPEVLKIAGELNEFQGHKSEAEEFFTLADQLDPYRFPWPPPVRSESGGFQQTEEPD